MAINGGRVTSINLPVVLDNFPTTWYNTIPLTKSYQFNGLIMQFTRPLVSGYNPPTTISGSGTFSNFSINNGMLIFNWLTPSLSSSVITFNNLWDGSAFIPTENFTVFLYDPSVFSSWLVSPLSQSYAYYGSEHIVVLFTINLTSIGNVSLQSGTGTGTGTGIFANLEIDPINLNKVSFDWTTPLSSGNGSDPTSYTLIFTNLVSFQGALY